MSLTDPIISLLVQVPIGIATLLLLYVFMRITSAERKQTAEDTAADRKAAAEDRKAFNMMFERMVSFAEKSLSHEADMTKAVNQIADINERLPELYQQSNAGYQARVLKNHEIFVQNYTAILETVTGVGEAISRVTLKDDLQQALNTSLTQSSTQHGVVVGKLDAIHQDVKSQINFGQVLDRMVEDSRAIALILDRFENQQGLVSQLRDALIDRVTSLEGGAHQMAEAIERLKATRPKTEPVPQLPSGVHLPLSTALDADAPPTTGGQQ